MQKVLLAYETKARRVIEYEKDYMRKVEGWHRAKGWSCIGYHYVIFPSGHVYEGRPLGHYGAHTIGGNDRVGYSFAGNYEIQKPTPQALSSFRQIMANAGTTSFVGHCELNATACPGKYLKQHFNIN